MVQIEYRGLNISNLIQNVLQNYISITVITSTLILYIVYKFISSLFNIRSIYNQSINTILAGIR